MRCNACWRELEGRAVSTTCGHLLCTEDASKILSTDAACPICDQVLSKNLMKPVAINPNDEWVNSAYKSVMFFNVQMELEMQYKINKMVAQCKQKCELMQEKFSEKLEQVHTAYLKMVKKCQMMEKEIESLSKDNQELQEKFSEKSRQKRKLDEMYDQLRSEYETAKRSAVQPVSSFYRTETGPFESPANIISNREHVKKDWSVFTPETPGPKEDIWPIGRQTSSKSGTFEIAGGSPMKSTTGPVDPGPVDPENRRAAGWTTGFGAGDGRDNNHPSMSLRNLILSPIKRPQLSHNRPHMFTL